MALVCPNYNSAEWKKLTQLLGEEGLSPNAQVKSMKMFMENGDSVDLALRKLDPARYSPRQKEEKLKAMSDRVVFIGSPDPTTGQPRHEYRDREGNLLTSVSRKLDETPALAYRGDDTGSLYADSGTNVHSIFEQYAEGVSLANIHEFAKKNGIPEHMVSFAASFIDNLKSTGTVLSEVNLVDLEHRVAGRGDLIHLKNDGTVDLYDIKSAYRTPHKIIGNKKIWNPLEDYEGYKAQRYTTQLEYYAQMIEKAIGHPVSNQFIIPIEIEFKENLPSNGIANASPVGVENTTKYGYNRRATENIDKAFGIKRTSPLVKLSQKDDSTNFIENLTGTPQSTQMNLDQQAEDMFVKGRNMVRTTPKGFVQYNRGGKWTTFQNQTSKVAQKEELIKNVLAANEYGMRDIIASVKNYVSTGEDAFISGKGDAFVTLRDILNYYKDKGYTPASLSDVDGFEDKKNWVVVNGKDSMDLLYIGTEDLARPFAIVQRGSFLGRVFGTDKSLFGNLGFNSLDSQYELSSKLTNTFADARKIEATMIAMKLKEADQSLAFDRILIYSTNQRNALVHHVELGETLPVLDKLFNHSTGKKAIPTTYLETIANKELLRPENYKQDFGKSYLDSLDDAITIRDRELLSDAVNYDKGVKGLHEFEASLLKRINEIQSLGDKSPRALEQKRLLSEWHAQIIGLSTATNLNKTTWFDKWISMPQNRKSPILQNLIKEYRDAVSRIRIGFWEDYKKTSREMVKKLFNSERRLFDSVKDYTISDTTKYYAPLLQTDEYSVHQIGRDGRPEIVKKTLPNYSLIPEGSDGFNNLSETQKEFIVHFNNTIEKAAGIMGIDWVRGRIPLMESSLYNKFYKAFNKTEGYDTVLGQMFNSIEDSIGNSMGDPRNTPLVLQNRFRSQANSETSDPRMGKGMLEVTPDKFIDLANHNRYETNLEVIADMFMMEALRVKEFNKIAGIFTASSSILEWQKANLFEKELGFTADVVEGFKETQLHMRDLDSGTIQSKIINGFNKIASVSLVTKPVIGAFNYLAQELTAFSQALSNSFANNGEFTASDWLGAFPTISNPKNYEKTMLLLEQLGMIDLSMAEMTNGARRYGNLSILRMRHLFSFLRWGDYLTRAQLMVAQMKKEGTWDAYSVVDGKLAYDENNDSRINGTTYTKEEGQALKRAIAEEQGKQGIAMLDDGKLPQAYGTSDGNRIRNIAAKIMGGFDRDEKGMYGFIATGKALGFLKTWLPARLNMVFDRPFISQIDRDLQFEIAPDGAKRAIWTGRTMEGMVQTMMYMAWYINKYRKNPYQKLTPHQQNNLRLMMIQLIILSSTSAIIAGFDDDDLKDPATRNGLLTLQRSRGDLVANYNLWELRKVLYTPISLVFMERTINQTWSLLSGDKKPNSKTLTNFVDRVPVANAFHQIYEVVDGEDDNTNN